jgi:hypothetical protein
MGLRLATFDINYGGADKYVDKVLMKDVIVLRWRFKPDYCGGPQSQLQSSGDDNSGPGKGRMINQTTTMRRGQER